jgi:hypothetical protein
MASVTEEEQIAEASRDPFFEWYLKEPDVRTKEYPILSSFRKEGYSLFDDAEQEALAVEIPNPKGEEAARLLYDNNIGTELLEKKKDIREYLKKQNFFFVKKQNINLENSMKKGLENVGDKDTDFNLFQYSHPDNHKLTREAALEFIIKCFDPQEVEINLYLCKEYKKYFDALTFQAKKDLREYFVTRGYTRSTVIANFEKLVERYYKRDLLAELRTSQSNGLYKLDFILNGSRLGGRKTIHKKRIKKRKTKKHRKSFRYKRVKQRK